MANLIPLCAIIITTVYTIFFTNVNMFSFVGNSTSYDYGRPEVPINPEHLRLWREKATRKKVAIVGGGVAGLGALKTFFENSFTDVVLLEAQDRLGGRVQTYRNGSVHMEDGAEWIHGEEGNIVYRIAQELGEVRQPISDEEIDYRIVRQDGSSVSEDFLIAEKVEKILTEVMENGVLEGYTEGYGEYILHKFEQDIAKGRKSEVLNSWLHYMEQTINAYEGTSDWNDIAATDADAWVDLGENRKWKDGFDTLIKDLVKSAPLSTCLLSTPVKYIVWDDDVDSTVLLVTENGKTFIVDHVVVTVSVEYLKRQMDSIFIPSIPNPLRTSLQGISLGGPNKLFIGWSSKWWGNNHMQISILWTKFELPSSMDWMYGIVNIYTVEEQETMLQIFVSGDYSLKMEKMNETQLQDDLLYLLKKIFRGVTIPEHNFFRRTRWNANPWVCGSYGSYITVEGSKAGLRSRAPFRVPLVSKQKAVIHWAGEHTHDTRYGTVDGALMTGIREAKIIMKHSGLQVKK